MMRCKGYLVANASTAAFATASSCSPFPPPTPMPPMTFPSLTKGKPPGNVVNFPPVVDEISALMFGGIPLAPDGLWIDAAV